MLRMYYDRTRLPFVKHETFLCFIIPEEMLTGKIPTTPTISSIIGGIEVQEAVKLIHNREDLPTLAGKGYFFNGLNHDSYVVEYQFKEDCPSHESFENIIELDHQVANTTAAEILDIARKRLGPEAIIDLHRELVLTFKCEQCQSEEEAAAAGTAFEKEARCPGCEK